MTIAERCIAILKEGPSPALDIALEIGVTKNQVHDSLRTPIAKGLVRRRQIFSLLPHEPQKEVFLYELADYGVQP